MLKFTCLKQNLVVSPPPLRNCCFEGALTMWDCVLSTQHWFKGGGDLKEHYCILCSAGNP